MSRSEPNRSPHRTPRRAPAPAPITPLPARVRAASTLYLFGGSFDPPHHYHLRVAGITAAHAEASNSEPTHSLCLYVPAARSPLKQAGPTAGDAARVRMLRAALRGVSNAAIWSDEVDRAKWQRRHGVDRPSYSIDTVKRLRSLLPKGTCIHLVIGADQAAAFHRWRSARALVRLAQPLVLPREGIRTPADLRREVAASAGPFWSVRELDAWSRRLLDAPVIRESSTRLRRALAGSPAQRARALRSLPLAVARIVDERNLYASPPVPRRRAH
ncbi:MAG TPA: nicotinate-nicotinamide nucleotide adenylyltransferase [Phycisphaerales bacterium]|nr:nicotinate-nicotinamide nucleotide adenylyltransferase [Phycisphaerales bacterium]